MRAVVVDDLDAFLGRAVNFYVALTASTVVMIGVYLAMLDLLSRVGVKL